MQVKHTQHPDSDKKFFLGANIVEMMGRPLALSLEKYIGKALPDPPATLSYFNYRGLDPTERQVFGNDTVGNCVEADILHSLGVINYNAGTPVTFTDEQGIELYSDITGYVPGDPNTDQGTVPQDALNYAVKNGVFGHPVTGWVNVNAQSMREVRLSIWLFENASYAVGLPDAWIAQPPTDWFTWGVEGEADPNNGHFFLGAGYDEQAVIIDTWGLYGVVTNGATKTYATGRSGGQMFAIRV